MSITRLATKLLNPLVGMPSYFNWASRDLLVVFNYHEISDEPSQFCKDYNLNVAPSTFRKQLLWIKNNFNLITPWQLISGDFKMPAALVTFDDGFAGVFNHGMEIMRDLNVPAVIFVNMAPILGSTCWSGLVTYLFNYNKDFKRYYIRKYGSGINSISFLSCKRSDVEEFIAKFGEDILVEADVYHGKFMTHSDLLRSADYGVFIGNHLYNHYNSANISAEELTEQYSLNESFIKKYVNYVPLFSYPFGQPGSCYNYATDDLLLSAGAKYLFSAMPFLNRDRSARVIHRTAMFESISSESLFRSNVMVPAYINSMFRSRRLKGL